MNRNRNVPNKEYDELSELEKYMETFNPQKPSANQMPRQPKPQMAKKYEECPECDKKFDLLKDLTEHFNEVHEEDSEEDEISSTASFMNNNQPKESKTKVSQGDVQAKIPAGRVPQISEGIKGVFTAPSQVNKIERSSPQHFKRTPLTGKSAPKLSQGIKGTSKPLPQTEVKMIKDTLKPACEKPNENVKILPKVPNQLQHSRVPTPRQAAFISNPVTSSSPILTSATRPKSVKPQVNSPKVAGVNSQAESINKKKLAEKYRLEIQRKIALNAQAQKQALVAKGQANKCQEVSRAQSAPAKAPTFDKRPVSSISSHAPSPYMNRNQISGAKPSFSSKPRPSPTVPQTRFVPDSLPAAVKVTVINILLDKNRCNLELTFVHM